MKKRKRDKKPADKSTVFVYKHFNELRDCLASGWPATLSREYLIQRHGSEGVPSEVAIQRWRDKHMDSTVRVLPHALIEKKLKGVAFKVDVIGHLSRLIALCEDRVARGLDQEDKLFGGMPLPVNDGVMQTYLVALRDYVKVAQDLGLLPAPPPPVFDMSSKTLNITPEALIQLRETVREIRLIEQQSGQEASESRDLGIKMSQKTTEEIKPKQNP